MNENETIYENVDETINETLEAETYEEVAETDAAVDPELGDLLGDFPTSGADPLEGETYFVSPDSLDDSEAVTDQTAGADQSSDLLDVSTFEEGVQRILDAINGTDQELFTGSGVASIADIAGGVPWNAVTFTCEGQEILFPAEYAQEVYVDDDGQLINTAASYTFGVVLRDSGLSNYVSSEVTVPTYHSATWYQYLYNYGQPYRIVDRYVNNNGYYSSYTREYVDLEFSGGNDWAGWDYGVLLLFVVVIILLLREVRSWLR